MGEKDVNQIKSDDLRKKAEEKLRHITSKSLKKLSAADSIELIHELQVHQIELEMQNDELRRAHEEIEKSRSKYADLYDFAPVGYLTFDKKGLILEANLTVTGLLGIERSILIKKPFRIYIDKDSQETFYYHSRKVFESSEKQTAEIKIKKKDGNPFYAQLESIAVDNEKGEKLCRTSVIDINLKKNIASDLEKIDKLESIGVLAGGIAHDFNNILAGIRNNIHLSKMQVGSESNAYENLVSAENVIDRATDLTQQLLTFARGGAPVKKIAYISNLIREATEFALRGSNINCQYNFADDLCRVEVDTGQIHQVMHNIVLNAVQSMPEGGSIRISADNCNVGPGAGLPLQTGKYVRISVQDKGIGVSVEHLQKIFDPYFTTKESGRGLGLAVVYSIIRKHEGHISVESDIGVGTTFNIYLRATEKQIEEGKSVENTFMSREGKVLIMDDEEIIRESLGEVLTFYGYEIECTKDGEETIELYKKAMQASKPFDAVILDLTVRGGMGGKEAIKKLREIDPNIKAIVASGYSNDLVLANFKEYGFVGVFAKHDKTEELGNTLHQVING